MIEDDFESLLKLISDGIQDGSRTSNDEIIEKTYLFFSKLKSELKEASPEEKDGLIKMIKTMQDRVNLYAKKVSEKTGMSEDELANALEREGSFTPMQKKVIDMTKEEIRESSQDLKDHLSRRSIEPKMVQHSEKEPKEASPKKKKRKDGWIKS